MTNLLTLQGDPLPSATRPDAPVTKAVIGIRTMVEQPTPLEVFPVFVVVVNNIEVDRYISAEVAGKVSCFLFLQLEKVLGLNVEWEHRTQDLLDYLFDRGVRFDLFPEEKAR